MEHVQRMMRFLTLEPADEVEDESLSSSSVPVTKSRGTGTLPVLKGVEPFAPTQPTFQVEEHLETFERKCFAQRVYEGNYVRLFYGLISDVGTADWFRSNVLEQNLTWEEARQMIVDRYVVHSRLTNSFDFLNFDAGGRTIAQFADAFLRSAARVQDLELLKTVQFLNVIPADTRDRVLQLIQADARPLGLDAVVRLALLCSTTVVNARHQTSSPSMVKPQTHSSFVQRVTDNVPQRVNRFESSESKLEAVVSNSGQSGQSRGGASPSVVCWVCGKPGHRASRCRERKATST
eukprot:TRINITY_DN415_c0_g1_i3.p1 TRINITY_DN415_c0_g1~~TRINITY_DN415_c0_g1_i3.p1  ORF type:complete len:292 (+),score=0.25 TRINITY_DN415_c0_g1_i3:55-930(+)